jgi:3-dehydroquinate synthase
MRSLKHKAHVVENDEREGNLRKILNFGHTIGHAIEASAGYGKYLHGEAVAIGMVAACAISRKFAGLDERESDRLRALIQRAGLPTSMDSHWKTNDFMRALRLDKKRLEQHIEFILIEHLGNTVIRKMLIDDIFSLLG